MSDEKRYTAAEVIEIMDDVIDRAGGPDPAELAAEVRAAFAPAPAPPSEDPENLGSGTLADAVTLMGKEYKLLGHTLARAQRLVRAKVWDPCDHAKNAPPPPPAPAPVMSGWWEAVDSLSGEAVVHRGRHEEYPGFQDWTPLYYTPPSESLAARVRREAQGLLPADLWEQLRALGAGELDLLEPAPAPAPVAVVMWQGPYPDDDRRKAYIMDARGKCRRAGNIWVNEGTIADDPRPLVFGDVPAGTDQGRKLAEVPAGDEPGGVLEQIAEVVDATEEYHCFNPLSGAGAKRLISALADLRGNFAGWKGYLREARALLAQPQAENPRKNIPAPIMEWNLGQTFFTENGWTMVRTDALKDHRRQYEAIRSQLHDLETTDATIALQRAFAAEQQRDALLAQPATDQGRKLALKLKRFWNLGDDGENIPSPQVSEMAALVEAILAQPSAPALDPDDAGHMDARLATDQGLVSCNQMLNEDLREARAENAGLRQGNAVLRRQNKDLRQRAERQKHESEKLHAEVLRLEAMLQLTPAADTIVFTVRPGANITEEQRRSLPAIAAILGFTFAKLDGESGLPQEQVAVPEHREMTVDERLADFVANPSSVYALNIMGLRLAIEREKAAAVQHERETLARHESETVAQVREETRIETETALINQREHLPWPLDPVAGFPWPEREGDETLGQYLYRVLQGALAELRADMEIQAERQVAAARESCWAVVEVAALNWGAGQYDPEIPLPSRVFEVIGKAWRAGQNSRNADLAEVQQVLRRVRDERNELRRQLTEQPGAEAREEERAKWSSIERWMTDHGYPMTPTFYAVTCLLTEREALKTWMEKNYPDYGGAPVAYAVYLMELQRTEIEGLRQQSAPLPAAVRELCEAVDYHLEQWPDSDDEMPSFIRLKEAISAVRATAAEPVPPPSAGGGEVAAEGVAAIEAVVDAVLASRHNRSHIAVRMVRDAGDVLIAKCPNWRTALLSLGGAREPVVVEILPCKSTQGFSEVRLCRGDYWCVIPPSHENDIVQAAAEMWLRRFEGLRIPATLAGAEGSE
jgi:hypothetical protein